MRPPDQRDSAHVADASSHPGGIFPGERWSRLGELNHGPAHYEISSSPTIGDHGAPFSQVKGLAALHTCPPSHTGDHASCDHTATTNDTRRAPLAPEDSTQEDGMSSNPISHLPYWQAARLAVLLDALDGVTISDSQRASLTWLAGFEAHTAENVVAVITRARQTRGSQGVDLIGTGDLVESGSQPAVSLRSASVFSQVGSLSTVGVHSAQCPPPSAA
jgi:hypothetical protein